MKYISALQLLPYVLFLATSSAWPWPAAAATPAVRADLTHVDSGRGFSNRELLRRMAARSRARASRFYSSSSSSSAPGGHAAHAVTAPLARGTADADSEYLIHLSIGTPRPQRVALTLDTGSDLVWTQCACQVCFTQPFPTFDALASQTTLAVPCSDPICGTAGRFPLSGCTFHDNTCFYLYYYADKSITSGRIVQDTFTFRNPHGNNGSGVAVPNVRFGCGQYNKGVFKSNESGIAGFGRGSTSLPSQLKVARFSHCFTPIADARSSPVFLGAPEPDDLGAHATGPIQSTPFASSNGSLYYLTLKGITVGKTRLPFNASAFGGSGGGTIIDSGTGITSLPGPVYRSLRAAFVAQVKLPLANESAADAESTLCFEAAHPSKVAVPRLVFHLEGADWDLPRESYVLDMLEDEDGSGSGLCLVMNSAGDDSDLTIIGNFQQQNMHIAYDLEKNKLVFAPARCDKM